MAICSSKLTQDEANLSQCSIDITISKAILTQSQAVLTLCEDLLPKRYQCDIELDVDGAR